MSDVKPNDDRVDCLDCGRELRTPLYPLGLPRECPNCDRDESNDDRQQDRS